MSHGRMDGLKTWKATHNLTRSTFGRNCPNLNATLRRRGHPLPPRWLIVFKDFSINNNCALAVLKLNRVSQVVDDICSNTVAGKDDAETIASLSGWIRWEGGARTNATVTLSRLLASCVALCRRDDIWHRLPRVGGSPLLMLVQTVRLRQQPPNALMQLANRV